jgi:hypothetical protein
MRTLVYEDDKQRTWLRLTAETPEEAFELGVCWWDSRNNPACCVKRTHGQPQVEFELQPSIGLSPTGPVTEFPTTPAVRRP